ncbi:MAG: DoxX family protein [bacterium]
MSFIPSISSKRVDSALLALRLVAGSIFIAHGAQKVFVYGFAGVTGAFGQMGVPMPGVVGPFIALLELFGGIALVVGLLTQLAAFGLALDMVGAILLVHLKGGFFLPAGSEFALACLGLSTALALTGAGRFSLDALVIRGRAAAVTGERQIVRKAA